MNVVSWQGFFNIRKEELVNFSSFVSSCSNSSVNFVVKQVLEHSNHYYVIVDGIGHGSPYLEGEIEKAAVRMGPTLPIPIPDKYLNIGGAYHTHAGGVIGSEYLDRDKIVELQKIAINKILKRLESMTKEEFNAELNKFRILDDGETQAFESLIGDEEV